MMIRMIVVDVDSASHHCIAHAERAHRVIVGQSLLLHRVVVEHQAGQRGGNGRQVLLVRLGLVWLRTAGRCAVWLRLREGRVENVIGSWVVVVCEGGR